MTLQQEIASLNPKQREAVKTTQGRLLILAGAGSGKTRVLTLRMAYLIATHGVSPQSILGLTFTNKAAAEMRHRLATFIPAALARQVTLCTFHSFCMQVLRKDITPLGYTPRFSLYDEQDVQRLINAIARDLLAHEGELPSLAPTVALIREAKNRGMTPEEMTGNTWHEAFAQQVYRRLLACMRAYNAVDFDHLLWLTVELFDRFPEVLHAYQERFQYVMIDEYQDTNPIQYRLAALLTARSHNLCVVGDDDQSIYGWRGAEVKNILLFDQASIIKLEQNYRSTNVILKAANAVIQHNTQRHSKVLWSDKGEGEKIAIFHAPDEREEAESVVKRLVRLREQQQWKWGDFAILYRSNALSRQFELALMRYTWKEGEQWKQGIPYEVVGGTEFYERREVKDLCAYLRVVINPLDQEALLRIINQPRRGIGDETLDKLTSYNRSSGIPLWSVLQRLVHGSLEELGVIFSSRILQAIRDFMAIIEEAVHRFANRSLCETLSWLVERIDYARAIREEVKSQQMRDFKLENVQEFINSLAEFEHRALLDPQCDGTLEEFLSQVTLDQQSIQANQARRHEDKVQLMTFHSAKGLEFPACFLVGLEDHIMPHEKSMKGTGIAEERRLMYVALTRPRLLLTLSMAQRRKRMGKDIMSHPSRFLFEIPKELLDVRDWRAV